MFCRAFHAHGARTKAFEPRQRHAREHEQQQQIHHEVEYGFVGHDTVHRHEILEEDVSLQRHPTQSEIRHGLDPTHGYKQEPTEGEAHVHISQQGIDTEYTSVQQRLAHHLPHGGGRARRGDTARYEHPVALGQTTQPRDILDGDDGKHDRRAHDERYAEFGVKTHVRNLPVCV